MSAFGLGILGYLGYRAVRWLIHQCSKTKKTDKVYKNIIKPHSTVNKTTSTPSVEVPKVTSTTASSSIKPPKRRWWSKINDHSQLKEFKKNWKNLTLNTENRVQEAEKLRASYEQGNNSSQFQSNSYKAPLGFIHQIPGNFGMWMPGVAFIASYLAKKKQIEGLRVCQSLEALASQIKEIALNPSDQRYAFIVGALASRNNFEVNFPQHKVTVCVEKKEGKLTITLLDAQPEGTNKHINPHQLLEEPLLGNLNNQELIFRFILKACRDTKCQPRLLHSQVLREKFYGCAVFAIQDGLTFLRDPHFFNHICCSEEEVKVDQDYKIEVITRLPPEFMVGTQSFQLLSEYLETGNPLAVEQPFPGKKKKLQNYLDKYLLEVSDKTQNHYITKKSFKYLNFLILSLQNLTSEKIKKITDKILVTKIDPTLFGLKLSSSP